MHEARLSWSKKAALGFVFVWFFMGGVTHFTSPDFYMGIVPPWLPFPLVMVYVSGVFELLGALGLLYRPLRSWAGAGLFVLTLAVTPVNVYMWYHPDLFTDVPAWFLSVRLAVQVFLLWCILWSTQDES